MHQRPCHTVFSAPVFQTIGRSQEGQTFDSFNTSCISRSHSRAIYKSCAPKHARERPTFRSNTEKVGALCMPILRLKSRCMSRFSPRKAAFSGLPGTPYFSTLSHPTHCVLRKIDRREAVRQNFPPAGTDRRWKAFCSRSDRLAQPCRACLGPGAISGKDEKWSALYWVFSVYP